MRIIDGGGRALRATVDAAGRIVWEDAMTITLPKPLRTYQYRPLTVFSLLDTDTDRVLPQLFETCVKGGRSSRSRTRAGDFAGYRDAMIDGGGLVGFDDDRDRALLDGWLRSCVVDMGAIGRSKSGEQMLAVAPLTLAAYRAGLPKERTRHRGIDDVIYHLLLDAVARRGSTSATDDLRELVTRTVGRGLAIGPQPRWEPQIADVGDLDIGALLEFRFVEGFEMLDAVSIDHRRRHSVARRRGPTRRHVARSSARLRRPAAGARADVELRRADGPRRVRLQPADRRRRTRPCCAPGKRRRTCGPATPVRRLRIWSCIATSPATAARSPTGSPAAASSAISTGCGWRSATA